MVLRRIYVHQVSCIFAMISNMPANPTWPHHPKHFSVTFPETCENPPWTSHWPGSPPSRAHHLQQSSHQSKVLRSSRLAKQGLGRRRLRRGVKEEKVRGGVAQSGRLHKTCEALSHEGWFTLQIWLLPDFALK